MTNSNVNIFQCISFYITLGKIFKLSCLGAPKRFPLVCQVSEIWLQKFLYYVCIMQHTEMYHRPTKISENTHGSVDDAFKCQT